MSGDCTKCSVSHKNSVLLSTASFRLGSYIYDPTSHLRCVRDLETLLEGRDSILIAIDIQVFIDHSMVSLGALQSI